MEKIIITAPDISARGGWVLDTQFVLQMGVPYLLAHGLGQPVADASVDFHVSVAGDYSLFVYTFNWVAPWKPQYAPGVFEMYIDDVKAGDRFGVTSPCWGWENGGSIHLNTGSHCLRLHDLTGFEGRVGMIVLAQDADICLPKSGKEVSQFVYQEGGVAQPIEEGSYQLVVCGGGIPGICTALSAARNGLKVALIQDRPVVGGNNSSEVRVWLGGKPTLNLFLV